MLLFVYVYVVVMYVVYVTLQHGRTASPNAVSIINNQSIKCTVNHTTSSFPLMGQNVNNGFINHYNNCTYIDKIVQLHLKSPCRVFSYNKSPCREFSYIRSHSIQNSATNKSKFIHLVNSSDINKSRVEFSMSPAVQSLATNSSKFSYIKRLAVQNSATNKSPYREFGYIRSLHVDKQFTL